MRGKGRTPARQFRLGEEVLDRIDWLAQKRGGASRAQVIREAVSRLAEAEGYKPKSGRQPRTPAP
jgi:metal-responsive CopG/Arc/MetJ family transcriptional regulator